MLRYCLPALGGAILLGRLPALPGDHWRAALALACLLCAGCKRTRGAAALCAGGWLMWAAAAAQLAERLPDHLQGNTLTFQAQILEFPQEKSDVLRLVVTPAGAGRLPGRLRLAWYGAEHAPRAGELWQFSARLRRPRGSRNPGGFDYAGWLFRQRIGATGYVLDGVRLGEAPGAAQTRLRRRLVARIDALLPKDDASAALLAISIGARQRITRDAWERYAVTGTSHLMAISGLHVGLAAGGAGLLAWGLCAVLRPRANARDAAVLAGLAAAAAYSTVSGFAVPTQRSLLMIGCGAGAWLARRTVSPARLLAGVAILVLLVDPLALHTPGFQLSFGAVAILMWLARRGPGNAPRRGGAAGHARIWLRELCVLQGALLLGLFPLTALLFQRVAWLAPLTNLLVLPVFSLITVPSALAGLLLAGLPGAPGDALLWLAYYSLRAVQQVLAGVSSLPGAVLPLATPRGALAQLLFLLPALWVLLPAGFPGRALAWLAFVAALAWRPPGPPFGCADVHTLDVGQGLASVVRTATRTLVFDTGPGFRGGGDSAEFVVLPFLKSLGIRRINRLLISHADQDHAGGVATLMRALPIADVMSGEWLDVPGLPERRCRAGQRWHWDGVGFRVLHPPPGAGHAGNDGSCVLEISAAGQRALLTGDIESRAERELVRAGKLRPAVLVGVPHHGSRTSSTRALIEAVRAETAVVSAGHRNRWGFPREDVVSRWQASGAGVLTTARSGTLHHRLCGDAGLQLLEEYRPAARRYWHDASD